jgi:hypothetical protein
MAAELTAELCAMEASLGCLWCAVFCLLCSCLSLHHTRVVGRSWRYICSALWVRTPIRHTTSNTEPSYIQPAPGPAPLPHISRPRKVFDSAASTRRHQDKQKRRSNKKPALRSRPAAQPHPATTGPTTQDCPAARAGSRHHNPQARSAAPKTQLPPSTLHRARIAGKKVKKRSRFEDLSTSSASLADATSRAIEQAASGQHPAVWLLHAGCKHRMRL